MTQGFSMNGQKIIEWMLQRESWISMTELTLSECQWISERSN